MYSVSMKIFVIAGEASGDWLGAKLIRELRALDANVELQIIGGKKMEAEGVESLFPSTELSIMGFAEILPHIPRLKRRISQTVKQIRKFKPDVLVTIDSPGFNFRVAKQLQEMRPETKFVHYVAPTVWAYKPERAAKTAEMYDKLLCILPFEPIYFTDEGLDADFIGHPLLEDKLDAGDAEAFKERHGLTEDFICMMPGSRKGELKRMLPVFHKVTDRMDYKFVIIAADHAKFTLEAATKNWKNPPLIVDNAEKLDCFAASKAGIIKSGTAGLEYAFAGKPFVVAYKVNPMSAYMMRRMIRIKSVNLVNILLDNEVIPELLQEDCEAEYIIENLMQAIAESQDLIGGCKEAIALLQNESGAAPTAIAAQKIMEMNNV